MVGWLSLNSYLYVEHFNNKRQSAIKSTTNQQKKATANQFAVFAGSIAFYWNIYCTISLEMNKKNELRVVIMRVIKINGIDLWYSYGYEWMATFNWNWNVLQFFIYIFNFLIWMGIEIYTNAMAEKLFFSFIHSKVFHEWN